MSNDNKLEEAVQSVPNEVLTSLDAQIEEAGGALTTESTIARTMFDTPNSEDGTVTILMSEANLLKLPSQSMVRVKSSDGRVYLAAMVKGPFAEPDGLRADSAPLVAVSVNGGILTPRYHGRAQIELLFEELEDGTRVPPRRRPLPNSEVYPLTDEETKRMLQLEGNMRLGLMEGHEEIEVRFPSDKKGVLPRHLGVLGTTGGGKSTTVSGLLYQFAKAGIATVVFDTEGEYTAINEPSDNDEMKLVLARRGLQPDGIKDTQVYHLVGREPKNPDHPKLKSFGLAFSELSPFAYKEILGMNDAQQQRFFKAYDIAKALLRDFGVFPKKKDPSEERQALELDEEQTGYPRMTLSHLMDIVSACADVANGSEHERFWNTVFEENHSKVMAKIKAEDPSHVFSWRKLLGQLGMISRLKIFDNPEGELIDFGELLVPGRVSLIDLSDMESPMLRNLVIAQLLRGIQIRQDANYDEATKKGEKPVLTSILIEEAHEFLSADRIREMPILFDQVARVAKRGRKRWLGLVFITQFPQHLPEEVLGLINNWILHKISDANVVTKLKRSVSGLDETQWRFVTSLAPGQAIVSMTSQARPVLAAIDPTPVRLLMID